MEKKKLKPKWRWMNDFSKDGFTEEKNPSSPPPGSRNDTDSSSQPTTPIRPIPKIRCNFGEFSSIGSGGGSRSSAFQPVIPTARHPAYNNSSAANIPLAGGGIAGKCDNSSSFEHEKGGVPERLRQSHCIFSHLHSGDNGVGPVPNGTELAPEQSVDRNVASFRNGDVEALSFPELHSIYHKHGITENEISSSMGGEGVTQEGEDSSTSSSQGCSNKERRKQSLIPDNCELTEEEIVALPFKEFEGLLDNRIHDHERKLELRKLRTKGKNRKAAMTSRLKQKIRTKDLVVTRDELAEELERRKKYFKLWLHAGMHLWRFKKTMLGKELLSQEVKKAMDLPNHCFHASLRELGLTEIDIWKMATIQLLVNEES